MDNTMLTKIVPVTERVETLYKKISGQINSSHFAIQRSINTEMVRAYWHIGKAIVEDEQAGQSRAEYGKEVLKQLSERLQKQYKKGFGLDTLIQSRKFYTIYHGIRENKKVDAVRPQLESPQFNKNLSWTHYRALMRVKNPEARIFYENEASKNCWSARELQRQIGSLLFDRLSKSKNKSEVLRLAHEGQIITKPEDAIKEPLILEFLGLPESHQLIESNVEEALANNLQNFLLELGNGFAFVARQKRLSLDDDHYYADLVFYHTILKCYIVIDIKTHKLTHADLGQIQLYVNYFDEEIKQHDDNPTIGLILCTEKRDEMAKYLLGDKAKQIFSSTYKFHLPTEKELEVELKREMQALELSSP
ncbi:MAG: PDDEXK nuclease domain-containing protein [Coxiellaceae bacterium]|nr:PDDEXK nuclease domain-containing protein [Coxiellaceae bacterium]